MAACVSVEQRWLGRRGTLAVSGGRMGGRRGRRRVVHHLWTAARAREVARAAGGNEGRQAQRIVRLAPRGLGQCLAGGGLGAVLRGRFPLGCLLVATILREERLGLLAGRSRCLRHAAQLRLANLGVGLGAQALELGLLLHAEQPLRVRLLNLPQAAAGLRRLHHGPEQPPERWRDGDENQRAADVAGGQLRPDTVGPILGREDGEGALLLAAIGQAVPRRDAGGDQPSEAAEERLDMVALTPVPRASTESRYAMPTTPTERKAHR